MGKLDVKKSVSKSGKRNISPEDGNNKNDTIKKGTGIKNKKEKYIQKRLKLVNKVSLFKSLQNEERKRRKNMAIIGDLKPLRDALPSLDEVLKMTTGEKQNLKTGIKEFDLTTKEGKKTAKNNVKRNREKFIRQVTSYQNLLKDPDFRKNPRDAIRYHIRYTHGLLE
uniref:Ribosome biogenesis protein SLX9 n=2 Tax=Haematobia irritans TaxID=7368 RepID=A0A1L8EBT5_HAEIR